MKENYELAVELIKYLGEATEVKIIITVTDAEIYLSHVRVKLYVKTALYNAKNLERKSH